MPDVSHLEFTSGTYDLKDEMARDEITIINETLFNKLNFNESVINLNNLNLKLNEIYYCGGFYEINDGGQGFYIVTDSKSSISTPINEFYVQPLNSDIINVLQVGLKRNDENFDNSLKLNEILKDYKSFFFPQGKYSFKDTLIVNDDVTFIGEPNQYGFSTINNRNTEFIFNEINKIFIKVSIYDEEPTDFNTTCFQMKNITINSSNNSEVAIYLNGHSHKLINCNIQNFKIGIILEKCFNVFIENCDIHYVNSCLVAKETTHSCVLKNCYLTTLANSVDSVYSSSFINMLLSLKDYHMNAIYLKENSSLYLDNTSIEYCVNGLYVEDKSILLGDNSNIEAYYNQAINVNANNEPVYIKLDNLLVYTSNSNTSLINYQYKSIYIINLINDVLDQVKKLTTDCFADIKVKNLPVNLFDLTYSGLTSEYNNNFYSNGKVTISALLTGDLPSINGIILNGFFDNINTSYSVKQGGFLLKDNKHIPVYINLANYSLSVDNDVAMTSNDRLVLDFDFYVR